MTPLVSIVPPFTAVGRAQSTLRATDATPTRVQDALLTILSNDREEKWPRFFYYLRDRQIPVDRRINLVKLVRQELWESPYAQEQLSRFFRDHNDTEEEIVSALLEIGDPWQDPGRVWLSWLINAGLEAVVENKKYSPELRSRVYGWLWRDFGRSTANNRKPERIRWMLDPDRSEDLGSSNLAQLAIKWQPSIAPQREDEAYRRRGVRHLPEQVAIAREWLASRRGHPAVRWFTLLTFGADLESGFLAECLDSLLRASRSDPALLQAITLHHRDLQAITPLCVCRETAASLRQANLNDEAHSRLTQSLFQQITGLVPLGAVFDEFRSHATAKDETWHELISDGSFAVDRLSDRITDSGMSGFRRLLLCHRRSLQEADTVASEERAEKFSAVLELPEVTRGLRVDSLKLLRERMPVTTAICKLKLAGAKKIERRERAAYLLDVIDSHAYFDTSVLKAMWNLAETVKDDEGLSWAAFETVKSCMERINWSLHDDLRHLFTAVDNLRADPTNAQLRAERDALIASNRGLSELFGEDFQRWPPERFLAYARESANSPALRIGAFRLFFQRFRGCDLSIETCRHVREILQSEKNPLVRERMRDALPDSFACLLAERS